MDIKELKQSPAYLQLRAYVDEYVEAARRPYELGQLAKRVIARCNEQNPNPKGVFNGDIGTAFIWRETKEDHNFWECIHSNVEVDDLNPCPIYGPKKAKVVKVAPKKRVGWWEA